MSKEEKPLDYERRILDTKSVAQRIDLDYLKRPNRFRDLRRLLTYLAPAIAAAGVLPFLFGIGSGEKAFSNGAVARSHTMFESNCGACHTAVFSSVADAACKNCHDGPAHPAKAVSTGKPSFDVRCSQCHVEHRDAAVLAAVNDGNCTVCHGDLKANASNVKLAGVRISRFAEQKHPEFGALRLKDRRPLKLNHAVHMPAKPKTVGKVKLPAKCADCHVTDLTSPKGNLLPVTFEKNCLSCHKREMEFDVYQVLGVLSTPAPHTKDPQTIHNHIAGAYQQALNRNPMLPTRPLGREFLPSASPQAWLDKAVLDSEAFLFERKCKYCHEYDRVDNGFPVVSKAAPVEGRFLPGMEKGGPWFERGEFSHRAHRAVECASCHSAAKTSTKTGDVLIPKLKDCIVCHGSSGTHLDHCSQCHLYHNKSKESDRDRKPVEELLGEADSGNKVRQHWARRQ